MEQTLPHDPDDIGAQTAWLRALAVRLVGERGGADDLVQETFLVALKRPEVARSSLQDTRAWLYGIVRNVARGERRTASRRTAREMAYVDGKPDASEGTDEVVERASRARRLFDAVLSLDEPYRTAVLLAYEERLDAPTIAERTGVSPVAARKRISRGVQMLRDRLGASDEAHRPAWLMSLAGLTELRIAAPKLLITGATMTTKWAVTAAAIVALVAGLGFWAAAGPVDVSLEDHSIARSGTADAPGVVTELPDIDADKGSTARVAAASTAASGAAAATETRTLVGRVMLTDDVTPVAGASLFGGGVRDEEKGVALATTDRNGGFEIELRSDEDLQLLDGGLWARGDDIFDVHVAPARIATAEGYVLEIRTAALGSVLVHVVDASGGPAPDVRVAYTMKPTFGSDEQLWTYQGNFNAGKSDAFGSLTIEDLPVGTAVRIGVAGEWIMPAQAVIDPVTRRGEATLELRSWASIMARVEWPDGTPAMGLKADWVGTPSSSGSFDAVNGTVDASGVLTISDLSGGGGVLRFIGGGHHAPVHARVVRGETTDLGTLEVQKLVRVTGRAIAGDGRTMPADLVVCALRDGFPVAQTALTGSHKFELEVPPGALSLALTSGVNLNPTLPFRGTFLGMAPVVAPRDDVELRLAWDSAELTGRVDVTLGLPEVRVIAEESDVSFGQPLSLSGGASGFLEAQWEGDRFTIVGPPRKGVRVLVAHDRAQSAYSGVFDLAAGQSVDVGELKWTRSPLAVEVIGAEGEPLRDVVVTVTSVDRVSQEVRTGDSGVAEFDLGVGPYALRADSGAGSTSAWQLVHMLPGANKRLQLTVGDECLLNGRVYSNSGPAGGVGIRAQRTEPHSNLGVAATTGMDGSFAFKPLSPGKYRYWISGELVGHVDLRPGGEANLELEIQDQKATVEVLRGSKPFQWVTRLGASKKGPGDALWAQGRKVGPGHFEVSLPHGPLEFSLDLNGLGNNQSVFLAAPAASNGTYRLKLPETGIELRIHGAAAHSPCPAAYLEELDGEPAITKWGRRPELYAEDAGVDRDGTRVVRFPFLNPGARVEINGLDAQGAKRSEIVVVGAGGLTGVRWDG